MPDIDASDLPSGFQRVYRDAIDLGLAIRGLHSTEAFHVSDSVRDREGEAVVTVLQPVNPRLYERCVVRVHND